MIMLSKRVYKTTECAGKAYLRLLTVCAYLQSTLKEHVYAHTDNMLRISIHFTETRMLIIRIFFLPAA
jgi:hypothetical protein